MTTDRKNKVPSPLIFGLLLFPAYLGIIFYVALHDQKKQDALRAFEIECAEMGGVAVFTMNHRSACASDIIQRAGK